MQRTTTSQVIASGYVLAISGDKICINRSQQRKEYKKRKLHSRKHEIDFIRERKSIAPKRCKSVLGKSIFLRYTINSINHRTFLRLFVLQMLGECDRSVNLEN